MKNLIIIYSLIFVCGNALSQNKIFTLQKCIDTALQNNLQVNQSRYQLESDEVTRNQAKLNILPNVNASIGNEAYQGRGIDPSTNTYITQKFSSSNYNATANVTLFQGLTLRNLIRQQSLSYEAFRMDLQQQKDNITLNIILAYLQILNNQDVVELMKAQMSLTGKQVDRLQLLDEKGTIPPSELYDLQGEFANDQVSMINAQNNLEVARITICRLMNIPYDKAMVFEKINTENEITLYDGVPETAYRIALENFARVKAADLRMQSAQQSVKVQKGYLFPTVSVGTGVYSNYSSAADNAYTKQLKNNFSSSVGISLNIPIFNSLRARNNIKLAKISFKQAAFESDNIKTQLQQDIQESYNNMQSAFERYQALLHQADAYNKSFVAGEAKFNAGVGTSLDYLTVKNNIDKAKINLVSSKYDYILRLKILQYYQGR